jgi:putative transposase
MERKHYPTDLTDDQWELVRPLLPPAKPGGRPRSVDLREILNGIFYVVRGGAHWRMLPGDLPPWGTVHYYYRCWRLDGTWEKILEALRTRLRHAEGRKKSPSAAIVDSQTVRTARGGADRGYDAGKRMPGRKRHIIVDTLGLLLAVIVHSASVQDRDGIKLVGQRIRGRYPRLKLIWADGAYQAAVGWAKQFAAWVLELVRKPEGRQGFVVLPRRWVVERTFAWLMNSRRLARDYERLTESSEAMVKVAMIHLMLKRLRPA